MATANSESWKVGLTASHWPAGHVAQLQVVRPPLGPLTASGRPGGVKLLCWADVKILCWVRVDSAEWPGAGPERVRAPQVPQHCAHRQPNSLRAFPRSPRGATTHSLESESLPPLAGSRLVLSACSHSPLGTQMYSHPSETQRAGARGRYYRTSSTASSPSSECVCLPCLPLASYPEQARSVDELLVFRGGTPMEDTQTVGTSMSGSEGECQWSMLSGGDHDELCNLWA